MQYFNIIQEIESYLNVLLITLSEEEYSMFIENTPLLNEYDILIDEFQKSNFTSEFLQQVLKEVKNIMNNRVKSY